jgi:phospholipid/cholesterol/gamma-HCH transport system substrate-binding protein
MGEPMTPARMLAAASIALAVVVVALVARGGGEDPYRVRVTLPNAYGLRDDSAVVIGGIKAGKVELSLDRKRDVVAELRLQRKYGPVGKDASATISAVNLLGIKNVVLDPGDRSDPAADGAFLPTSRMKFATDLDQVLAVLDNDTRTRLAILMSEAGAGFAGRKEDFNTLLRELPPSIADADKLLRRLVSDNDVLARLVADSSRFVGALAGKRTELGDLIDTTGQAGSVVASRQADLASTLAKAPGTLNQLQHFLGRLRETTGPLGPAARDLTATAAPLSATLAQAEPFWKAAQPALAEARKAAPDIVKLAERATPVLQSAVPVSSALAQTSKSAQPVSDLLMKSSDNILAVVDNWSKAVQLRDGVSHVFRGEASYSPEAVQSMLRVLEQGRKGKKGAKRKTAKRKTHKPVAPGAQNPVTKVAPKVTGEVGKVLEKVLPQLPRLTNLPGTVLPKSDDDRLLPLLDYLIGS